MIRKTLVALVLLALSSCAVVPVNDVLTLPLRDTEDCTYVGMTQALSHGLTLSYDADRMNAMNEMRLEAEERGGNTLVVEWIGCTGGQAQIYRCP